MVVEAFEEGYVRKCNFTEGFRSNSTIWRGMKQKLAIFQNLMNNSSSEIV